MIFIGFFPIFTTSSEESHCSGMAPIIFNEEDYLGQFNEFFSARESDKGRALIQGQNFEILDEIEQIFSPRN